METKIDRIAHYQLFREDWFDIFYKSGRMATYTLPHLPKTAQDYIQKAEIISECQNYVTKSKQAVLLQNCVTKGQHAAIWQIVE